jgi:hypothetical protein
VSEQSADCFSKFRSAFSSVGYFNLRFTFSRSHALMQINAKLTWIAAVADGSYWLPIQPVAATHSANLSAGE